MKRLVMLFAFGFCLHAQAQLLGDQLLPVPEISVSSTSNTYYFLSEPTLDLLDLNLERLSIYGCSANTVPDKLPFFCHIERKIDKAIKAFDFRFRLK